MAALPYMQFYVADYLADTAHLTAAQHGAYLMLLFNYWQRGHALNNSNERLANVARMSSDEWAHARPVLAEFFDIDGDLWTHHRVESDLAAVLTKSTKARRSGEASARRRANERSTNAQRTLNHTDTDTDTDTDQNTSSPAAPVLAQDRPPDRPVSKSKIADSEAFEAFWRAYPRKAGKANAQKAFAKHGPGILPIVFADIEARIKAGEWSLDQPQYIPHPATYLNGKRWTDEITPRTPGGWKNGQPERISNAERVARDAERHLAELDRLDREESQMEQGDRALGYGSVPPDRLAVSGESG